MTNVTFISTIGFINIYTYRSINSLVIQHVYAIIIIIRNSQQQCKEKIIKIFSRANINCCIDHLIFTCTQYVISLRKCNSLDIHLFHIFDHSHKHISQDSMHNLLLNLNVLMVFYIQSTFIIFSIFVFNYIFTVQSTSTTA